VGIAIFVGVHTLKDFGRHARITKKICVPSFNAIYPLEYMIRWIPYVGILENDNIFCSW